jgi:type II secretory ATPase GspE/PulE/Tfp pilus assembly ATPase PilB-like protein
MPAWIELLAAAPTSGTYVNPWKLLGILAMFSIWAWFAQWVDKDTVAVNTFRVLWNLIVLACGAAALACGLFIPLYVIGFPLMAVIIITIIAVYVAHRNKLVKEEDRVFTAAHWQRIQQTGFTGKKKKKIVDVKERVRLIRADKKPVGFPEEEGPRVQYGLTQDLLFDALWRRASIIEVAPAGPQASKITYTIDGVLTEREGMERTAADSIVQFIKQIVGLNLEEHRKPQSGKMNAAIGDNKYELRVRTDGSTAGEKLTIRVVTGESRYKMKDAGFTDKQMERFAPLIDSQRGVVLLSAPKSAGLTTTVYAISRTHDAFLKNIQMIEYTKEMDIDNVTQHVYVPSDEKSFSAELQRIIRSDPDIMIVPEVRDRATAGILTDASINKQRVYVALNANDVFDALGKWLQLVGDKANVARSLAAIMNQRLLRVLCTVCKQPYKPDAATLKKLNLPADAVLYRPPEPQVDKHGNPIICQNCQGSGYVGRTAVIDMLIVDDGLRDVIRKASNIADIQTYVAKQGGGGIQAQALERVLNGATSIQEVVRVMRGQPPAGGSSAAPPPAKPKTPVEV